MQAVRRRVRSERGQQQEADHPYAMLVVHPSLLDGVHLNPIREKTRLLAGFYLLLIFNYCKY